MKKLFPLFLILFIANIYANGGPIDSYNIDSTGNIRFVRKNRLKLLKEDLLIKIDGVKALFEVKYVFQNTGGDDKIKFAFPVETIKIIDDSKINADKKIKTFIEKEKLHSYSIYAARKEVGFIKETKVKKLENEELIIKEWFFSEIEFKKFEKVEIKISYSVESYGDKYFYSCSSQPKISERAIRYNFYPASFFGNGTVTDLSVTIDYRNLKKINGEFLKAKGLDFVEKNDGVINFTGKDINFNKTKEILLSYDISNKEKQEYLNKKRMFSTKFKVINPTKPLTEVEKMFDFNLKTFLCLEKGEEIEISFDRSSLPGYGGIVLNNGKADQFKIEVDVGCDKNNGDHFGEKESFIYSPNKFRKCDLCDKSRCEMKEKKDCEFWTDCIYDLFDLGDYDATKVKECRLKMRIKPVGLTKSVSCISEILLLPHYQGN